MGLADDVLALGPVAYWRFSEPSGASVADSGPNGLTATLTGTTYTRGVAGIVDGDPGVTLATADRATASRTALNALASQEAFTLMVGLKIVPGANTGARYVWRYGSGAGGNGLRVDNGIMRGTFWETSGSQREVFAGGGLNAGYWDDDKWHLVFLTWSKATGNLILYIDGVEVGRTASTTTNMALPTAGDVVFGGFDATTLGWNSSLDEVAYFAKTLTPAEVAALSRKVKFQEGWFARNALSERRQNHGTFVLGDLVYMVGGYRNGGHTNTCIAFDPATGTVTTKAPYPWNYLTSLRGATLNGKGYIYGGYDNWYGVRRDYLYEYNPVANTWTLKGSGPYGLYTHVFAACMGPDNKEYLYTFWGASSYVYRWDPTNNTWTTGANSGVTLYDAQGCAHDGKLWGTGGGDTTLRCYDPIANTWSTKAAAPMNVLNGALVGKGEFLYLFGGVAAGYSWPTNYRKAAKYHIPTNTWTMLPDMPHGSGGGSGVLWNGKPMWIGGDSGEVAFPPVMSYTTPPLEGSAEMLADSEIETYAFGKADFDADALLEVSEIEVLMTNVPQPGFIKTGYFAPPIGDSSPYPGPDQFPAPDRYPATV